MPSRLARGGRPQRSRATSALPLTAHRRAVRVDRLLSFSTIALSTLLPPKLVYESRLGGVIGSHFFEGGVALFILLVALRRTTEQRSLAVPAEAPGADQRST